ncbi:DUF4153 domain-containing protein [Marimonas lutisalis]|uniref:DUF4153 domain-containing protein n=1 Tax=Marimonas lutisalis TaxID=2545756 RepID=UPI0010FA1C0D|nr:DUF4153 domain-containing protein [Marimonas lutisalis]
MAEIQPENVTLNRTEMALVGGFAGLALWLFVDVLPDVIDNDRLLLFLATLCLSAFAVLLALGGPERIWRAAIGALVLAVPVAGLMLWASYRFDAVEPLLTGGHGLVSLGAIVFVATPFVAARLSEAGGWARYALLFDASWMIVVRFVAAWLFAGLFWAVLMLSNELLSLVGVTLIEDILDFEPVPYVLTGLLLGLAIQVVHELRDYVSPFLIHRLLRLLLPMLLPVVVLFIAALPFRGLSGLFGSLSPAATLMAVAFAGVTLISTAIDRDDENATASVVIRDSARLMALTLPVLGGLALYAVWLRVGQYGWTPDRLLAWFAAGFIAFYGAAYALAVLSGARWMGRIREVNRWVAVGIVAAAALWLTPVVDAQKISANSQLARIEENGLEPGQMALWEMAHEWGHAGQAALDRMVAQAEESSDDGMIDAVARAREARTLFLYRQDMEQQGKGSTAERLHAVLAVRPEGRILPLEAFESMSEFIQRDWEKACSYKLSDGRPGCVAVLGQFRPGVEVPHGFVLLNTVSGRVRVNGFVLRDGMLRPWGGAWDATGSTPPGRALEARADAVIGAALDGAYDIVPAGVKALKIEGLELIPDN